MFWRQNNTSRVPERYTLIHALMCQHLKQLYLIRTNVGSLDPMHLFLLCYGSLLKTLCFLTNKKMKNTY